jgi:NAD(P)-dependent dehydrogenase (short-subunit alcohol dehydrogenase family)
VLNYSSDSSTEPTSALSSSLESAHSIKALPVQADMGDPSGPAHLITTAKNHFSHPKTGKFQIDILINNAGIAGDEHLESVTPEFFNKLYAVNVLGPLLLVQAALPYLPQDRSGRIVNISSVSSSLGMKRQSVYGGTKAALESMTRSWSRELAESATVNSVNPGPVATAMYPVTNEQFLADAKPFVQNAPLQAVRVGIDEEQYVKRAEKEGGRTGYDHEVAGVVAMLCSEDAGWCTGSVICANGGLKFSY